MSKNDSPAGSAGGPTTLPDLDALPEKMRVHALAKLIGVTSREILAALSGLGHGARSVQSSIERKIVEQIIGALVPGAADAAADAPVAEPVGVAPPDTAPPAALAPIFAPPAPLFQAPVRVEPVEEAPSEAPPSPRRRRRGKVEEPPAAEDTPVDTTAVADTAAEDTDDTADDTADDAEDDADESARRRRRRGRRGRGRGRGGDETDENETESDTGDESDEDTEDDETESESEGSRRRRRRRRRRGSGDDAADPADDDPPATVTRIRAPRESRDDSSDGDGVQSVRGSTRLEAKRQRRRDGRDAGRRRQPILSEAEFLARRESVERTMVVRERASRVEIGVLEDDVLVEHFVTGRDGGSLVGNIYLGRVQNVLPSMEAAFVDIGRGRNAVLYAGEVDWDAAGLGGKGRRIEQALSTGDSVLVQVTKDPIGHKGARLTTQISLAGRFLVYVPSGGAAGISRKLPDVERRRLKDMLRDIVPSEAGVIIRTASEGVSQEALERDVRRLQAQWEVVKAKSEQTGPNRPKAPALLYEEPDLLIKVVRDQFNEDFSRLVIQGDDAWDTLYGYLAHVAHELADRMHRHVGKEDVFNAYRIDEQLLKALDRKVWLPSGGTLVIDRTEAMTVIDVNTGKFTGSGGNLEETVTRNNLEAAEEIVRQLRLRDIGGIIVIDFIDMVLEANRDLVLRRLTECLARDRTRHQVAEVTSLGLVQMTRKRVGGGLLEHFSTPCEHCRGRGVIIDTEAIDAEPAKPDTGGGRKARGGRSRRGDGETNGHQGNGRPVNGSGSGGSDTGSVGDHSAVVAATAVIAAAGSRSGGTVAAGAPVEDDELADGNDVAAAAAAGAAEVADAALADAVGVDAVGVDTVGVESAPTGSVPVGSAVDSAPAGSAPAGPAPAGSAPAGSARVGSASLGSAPAGSAPAGSAPAGSARAGSARAGSSAVGLTAVDAAGSAVAPATAAPAAGASVAPAAPAAEGSAASAAPAGRPADDGPAEPPAPRRRRGRVTRTAGAPTVTEGEAPSAAVVTVPVATAPAATSNTASSPPASTAAGVSTAEPVADVAMPTVVPQPEPTAASRPRRGRRAASRPAGPPSEGNGDTAGGDPV